MFITRRYTKRYEVKFYPGAFINYTWGQFRVARERSNMSTKKLSRCFVCGRDFQDSDQLVFITVSGKGNMFSCTECHEKHKEE